MMNRYWINCSDGCVDIIPDTNGDWVEFTEAEKQLRELKDEIKKIMSSGTTQRRNYRKWELKILELCK